MERKLVKNINRSSDIEKIKEYIISNDIYSINYHIKEPYRRKQIEMESNILDELEVGEPIMVIKKRDMSELREKIRVYLENKKVKPERFVSPIEVIQEKILSTKLTIDFGKIQEVYNKTRAVPLTLFKNATYNDLLIYLPKDFDPEKYYQINNLDKISNPNNISFVRDMEYHYLKYGRFKNLHY